MSDFTRFPPQQLSYTKKTTAWRKKCVDWADSKNLFNFSPVRKSVAHKKINYDLINGKLHMQDMEFILNPDNIQAGYIPDRIQHYPIMNSKLNVLRGEESKRTFDFKVVVTNPNSITKIEENKKNELMQKMQELIQDTAQSEEEFNQELEKLNDYYQYEWQDMREVRANALLNHYVKEYNMPILFNQGFMDAVVVGEEIYQCDIVGGEPTIERLNPLKVRVFRSGFSNKIEDADVIILEDYWSPSKIIDTFYDVLTKKDMEYLEGLPDQGMSGATDSMDNIDERFGYLNRAFIGEEAVDTPDADGLFDLDQFESLMPYDFRGNVRVIRLYWKSRRKIKQVKSYNERTGEEEYTFYPENHVIDKDKGEEEKTFWINEAWEGTKIGSDIYVNMRPRPIQYNRISNPSRCHFGIIGTIYNLNDSKPFSLVDKMKPYNYLYDAICDQLNKLMAANWGKLVKLDLAMVPSGWDIEKWMYFARVNHIVVVDSFNEGKIGAATGKLAGGLNNASNGVIDAELSNSIQNLIATAEYIKNAMSDVAGISKQREGQISNRETVGGVERATLQSSYITEWLFFQHEDVKRRALECFIETAKIAFRGRSKKFQYILSDNSMQIVNIEGDEFAENDYGLVVDNNSATQELSQKLEGLAQAALQNQSISFSAMMKLWTSSSMAEKIRMIELNEQKMQQMQQQQQQMQMQIQQQQLQQQAQAEEAKMQQADAINQRDNETKILVAQINAQSKLDATLPEDNSLDQAKLNEDIRQFNETLDLDKQKFELEKQNAAETNRIKREQIKKQRTTTNTKK